MSRCFCVPIKVVSEYIFLLLIHTLYFYFYPADIISTVEFNSTGELLATGDKGGRVVVFQREQEVGVCIYSLLADHH